MPVREQPGSTRPAWPWPAKVILLISLALVVGSAAQLAYRATLPTEGWSYDSSDNFEDNTIIFTQNVLGGDSPIQTGDSLLFVEGLSVDQGLVGYSLMERWRAGQPLHYTVERAGQVVELTVPIKYWTLGALLRWNFGSPLALVAGLMPLFMLGISLFVLAQRPAEPAGWALLLLAAVLLANAISSLVPDGPTTQVSAVWQLAAFFSYWIWGILLGPSLFVLSLVFPHPKRLLYRWPWLGLVPFTIFWLITLVVGFRAEVGFGLTGVFFVLTLVSLIHSLFTQRDAVSRAQFLWGLGGLLAAVACFLPTFIAVFASLLGASESTLAVLRRVGALDLTVFAFPAFTVCLAIAILRYRLWDIEVILRRTLVYAVLTALLALAYFGAVLLLEGVVRPLTGQSQNPLVSVLSTLAIAALFVPLRRRVQAFIDRRFYRRKYDAARIIAAFGSTLRDEVALEQVTTQLVDVAAATVQPSHVSLWLPDRESPARSALQHAIGE
jgi:hypothetical protein